MISRAYDTQVFSVYCDSCSSDIEVDLGGDWQAMIVEIKEQGWIVREEDGEWKHHCPACVATAGKVN